MRFFVAFLLLFSALFAQSLQDALKTPQAPQSSQIPPLNDYKKQQDFSAPPPLKQTSEPLPSRPNINDRLEQLEKERLDSDLRLLHDRRKSSPPPIMPRSQEFEIRKEFSN